MSEESAVQLPASEESVASLSAYGMCSPRSTSYRTIRLELNILDGMRAVHKRLFLLVNSSRLLVSELVDSVKYHWGLLIARPVCTLRTLHILAAHLSPSTTCVRIFFSPPCCSARALLLSFLHPSTSSASPAIAQSSPRLSKPPTTIRRLPRPRE